MCSRTKLNDDILGKHPALAQALPNQNTDLYNFNINNNYYSNNYDFDYFNNYHFDNDFDHLDNYDIDNINYHSRFTSLPRSHILISLDLHHYQ